MTAPFLSGGGAVGELIRRHDWAASALGAPDAWPEALQNAVRIVLGSTQAVRLTWGADELLIYNDAYAELLGDRHPGALGRPIEQVWPKVRDKLQPATMRVKQGEAARQLDFTVTRQREGHDVPVALNFAWVPVSSGAVPAAGVLCFCREQTDAERDRAERDRELQRLRELFEQSPSFIAVLEGPQHVFRITNPAYLRLIGRRDVLGKPVRTAMPELAGQGFFELLDEVYRTGTPFVGQAMPVDLEHRPDAETRYVDFTYQPLRDEHGTITGVFVEGVDVTAAKRAHDVVQLSEEKFRTFAQVIPNQVWAAQPDGELDWFNDQCLAYAGGDPGVLAGSNWGNRVHPDDLSQTLEAWSRALVTGESYQVEMRLRRHDGAYRWHLVRAEPIRDAAGTVTRWIGASTDVEEERRARDELETINATLERRVEERTRERASLEDQLRQAQKMEAVGQLTGGIAHDFNNMLAAILGSIELTKRRVAAGRVAEVPKLLEQAESSIRRAAALTQRLLAFARRQPLDVRRVDVRQLLLSLQDMFVRTLGPGITLELSLEPGLWAARSDASQLESALLNLVINARDAMPTGGRLRVEASNGALDSEYAARQADVTAGDYVVLRISDNGLGMPADVLAKAFDPFFTTKPVGQGTGLGLSMVFGFMKQVGGHIRLHSQMGNGTTVTLYLPQDRSGASGVDAVASVSQSFEATGEVILLVEDDAALRELQGEILHELGYAHIAVEDGPAALRVLESRRDIDLLLTDVGLPGMNGRQLAEVARRLRPTLPIVFLTGFAGPPASEPLLERGMYLLTKPVEVEVLGARLREILARSGH